MKTIVVTNQNHLNQYLFKITFFSMLFAIYSKGYFK